MPERRAARHATLDTAGPVAHRQRRRKRPALVALVATVGSLIGIAVVVAVVAAVFVGGLVRSYDTRTAVIATPFPDGPRPAAAPAGAQNILLIGSDARGSDARGPAARGPDARSGTQSAGGRSDTLMLVHVPADRTGVQLVSIMRDSWVDVPGHGPAKINAAFAWGGVRLTVQTVEQLLDARIDHVAEVDFQGFAAVTDALGGVTVQSSRDFTARGHAFTRGANRVDGAAALAFVRERYAFADADHTRVRHQQAFVRGVVEQLLARGTVTNPGRIQDAVAAVSGHLAVDAGLDTRTLIGLGWSLRSVRPDDLSTATLPTAGSGTAPDGQSIVTLDTGAVRTLSDALRSDDVGTWLRDQR